MAGRTLQDARVDKRRSGRGKAIDGETVKRGVEATMRTMPADATMPSSSSFALGQFCRAERGGLSQAGNGLLVRGAKELS